MEKDTRFFSPFRFLVRCLANIHIPWYFRHTAGRNRGGRVDDSIIVSLTSFPARINKVWIVIECLLRQSLRPGKIVIWLSKEQFPTEADIPQRLKDYVSDGVQVRLVDGDIRSHKKYFYAFSEYKDKKVILVDDDIFYHSTLISNLIKVKDKHPNEHIAVCTYAYHIGYNKDHEILPYSKWTKSTAPSEADDLFFGSGGGTLIIPSELNNEWSNIDLASKLTPIADDVWLNAMARISGLRIIKTRGKIVLDIHSTNNSKLKTINMGMNQNDVQLKNVTDYYFRNSGRNIFLTSTNP